MQSHIIKRCIIAVLFTFLIPTTVWWGVHVVAPYPDYGDVYADFKEQNKEQIDALEKKEEQSKGKQKAYLEINKMWETSSQHKDYMNAKNRFDKVMLIFALFVGLSVLFIGATINLPIIGSGLIFGGTLCLTQAQFYQGDMKLVLCLVLTVALMIMLGFAYRSSREQ